MLSVPDKELFVHPHPYLGSTALTSSLTLSRRSQHTTSSSVLTSTSSTSFPGTKIQSCSSNRHVTTCTSIVDGPYHFVQPSIYRQASTSYLHSVSKAAPKLFQYLLLGTKPTKYFACRIFHTFVLSFLIVVTNLVCMDAFPTNISRTVTNTRSIGHFYATPTLNTKHSVTNRLSHLLPLEMFTIPNFTNSERPFSKLYMRSERTRRSQEYYRSNGGKTPMRLFTEFLGKQYTLAVTDDGKVQLSEGKQSFLLISVIVERQEKMNMNELLERLKPKDNSRIILQRFGTNLCVCMNQSGNVVTERLIDDTVSDNCEWRLRISRYGFGFERVFKDDAQPAGAMEPFRERIARDPRTATLSVHRSHVIASGWSYKLWQPEATWKMYWIKGVILQNQNPELRKNMPSSVVNTFGFPLVDDEKTDKLTEERSSMRVGEREVYSREALPQDIDWLYRQSQKLYCDDIQQKLLSTVKREVSTSIVVLNKLHTALVKLQSKLEANPSPRKSKSMARLLDEWLLLTYYRWQQKVQRLAPVQSSPQFTCSLSFQHPYLETIKHYGLFTAAALAKQEFVNVYREMFLNVYHLASWNASQKREWLIHPRLSKLFRYLKLRIPPISQLRQASFIIHRYLSQGKMYYLSDNTTRQVLTENFKDKKKLGKIYTRAALLKYEELRFWPTLHQRSGKKQELSLLKTEDLRMELLQLSNESYCAQSLFELWHAQRKLDSPRSCAITAFRRR